MTRLEGSLSAQWPAVLPDWHALLAAWAVSASGQATIAAVDARVAAGATVYPARVLRALELTPRRDVRVVILGQDPYHGPGQAEGLAFSVAPGVRIPPSLRNIFKELGRDQAVPPSREGSLLAWARQGVLLLNTTLTVEDGAPASHEKLGWQVLTHQLIKALIDDLAPKVFMLWGAHAQAVVPEALRNGPHRVLECNHPSPLSANRPPQPFMGCGHFGLANQFLTEAGRGAVDWRLG